MSAVPRLVSRRAALYALGAAAASPWLFASKRAWAGSYLDRAGLLIHQAVRDTDYLRSRLGDKELAAVVHRVAVARVKAATKMQVPKEVELAHPHVLLVLENHERAADAATKGQNERFFVYHERAREELRVLEGVLQQLGFKLPKPP
jgi:hypothetical protein